MGDVINLREARKKRTRQDKEAQASVNRVAFGRTRAEKLTAKAEEARKKAQLDGKRLDEVPPEVPED